MFDLSAGIVIMTHDLTLINRIPMIDNDVFFFTMIYRWKHGERVKIYGKSWWNMTFTVNHGTDSNLP